MLLFTVTETDPGLNLALEEYLLESPPPDIGDRGALLLYENAEALVIGKNQNPWREIPLPVLLRGRPRLYRRISGGGAVYHGRGNLNFAFIVPGEGFSKEGNLDLVRRALGRLGAAAERTGRGDLLVAGRKVSGNALCYRKGRVLHHGTLLVNADLAALRACLAADSPGASGLRIETRAVASVPMGVANLAEFLPGLTVRETAEAVAREAGESCRDFRAAEFVFDPRSRREIEDRRLRHESSAWVLGNTPAFTCRAGRAVLYVENGRIERTEGDASPAVTGDFLDAALMDAVLDKHRVEEESHGFAGHVSQARQNS